MSPILKLRTEAFRRRRRWYERPSIAQAKARRLIVDYKRVIRQALMQRRHFDDRMESISIGDVIPMRTTGTDEVDRLRNMRDWYDRSAKRASVMATILLPAARRRRW